MQQAGDMQQFQAVGERQQDVLEACLVDGAARWRNADKGSPSTCSATAYAVPWASKKADVLAMDGCTTRPRISAAVRNALRPASKAACCPGVAGATVPSAARITKAVGKYSSIRTWCLPPAPFAE